MTLPPVPPLPTTARPSAPVQATTPTSAPAVPAAPVAPVQGNTAPAPAPTSAPPAPATAVPVPTLPRSCESCMFYIAPNDTGGQELITGRATTGGAICGKKHVFLTNINTEMNASFKSAQLSKIANSCDSYAEGKFDNTVDLGTPRNYVSFGKMNTTVQIVQDDTLSTCRECVFFKPDSESLAETGIVSNICTANSWAIKNGSLNETAINCDIGVNVNNVIASPDIQVITYDHLKAPVVDNHVAPEPVKRGPGRPKKSDEMEPATEDDQKNGIKGWKRVEDSNNKDRFIMLPVFDSQFFDDDERAKIPMTGDDEHPEKYVDHQNLLYKTAAIWRGMNQTPALNGIAGVGKTEFFRYAAWFMGLPFERISITNRTELDDLAGKMQVHPDKGTYFQYGRIPKAWNKPCVIVIDEPNVGPPDVWQFLRPLTDNSKQLVLDMNNGERISKNEYCFMGMAFNPTWDLRNVGTHEISDADGSRLMHISVPAPTPTLEKRIIGDACKSNGYKIEDSMIETMMNIAKDLRELSADDFSIHWGVRQQIKVARSTQFFDLKDCYRMAAADLLDPEEAEQIFQIVKAHDPSQTNRRGPGRPRKYS